MTTAKKPSKPAKPSKAKPRPGPKNQQRGSSAVGERGAHNPDVVGSTPTPATTSTVDNAAILACLAHLKPKPRAFAVEYLKDKNATKAYIRAGYSAQGKSAEAAAGRLLRNVVVSSAIVEAEKQMLTKLQEDTGITKAKALAEAWSIVTANANELIEFRRTACDGCYGGSHTRAERARDPDPNCPECSGEGHGAPFVHDTRKLSPQAMALYAGIKLTKEGLEVKMHSKMDALEKVFKHLGLYKEDNDQKGKSAAEAMKSFVVALRERGSGTIPIARSAG